MILDFNYKDLDFININNDSVTVSLDRYWANKGHVIGEGMVSPDKRYFYLNIPKNSSSFIKANLKSVGWEYSNINEHPNSEVIVALRDPVERWVSGIVEYLYMYHKNTIDNIVEPFSYEYFPLLGEKLGLGLLFERITFDDHTERQSVFLTNLQLSKCHWLYIDKDFSNTFSNFLNTIRYTNNFVDPVNQSNELKKKLQNFFSYVIDNDEFKKYNIQQWFWCDQELINQVKFYDAR